jgi:hypothetical protein
MVASAIVYPEFKALRFLKEVFSLLCSYGAVFVWFVERIGEKARIGVAVCVMSCLAPVLFLNNPFGMALVCILLMMMVTFILLEHIRGCRLFSASIPIYVVCGNEEEAKEFLRLSSDRRILEVLVLSSGKCPNGQISTLKSMDAMCRWLRRINRLPFYPFPRRLMYYSREMDAENFDRLLRLSAEYSIPLFKAVKNTFLEQGQSKSSAFLNVLPVSFADFEPVNVSPQDRSGLSSVFKGKKIWICYDGRGSILDLLCAISLVNPADITLLCESEKLMVEAERELQTRCANANYRLKIFDLDLLPMQEMKPDIFFYNIPIKSLHFGEYHLKETVMKNVLDTQRLIQFAQSSRIPMVFVMSSLGSSRQTNWIWATQRLGELAAQFADYQSRKYFTKFRVVRLPEGTADELGIFGKIMSSISSNGYVNVDFPHTEFTNVHYRQNLLPPLLKIITSGVKAYDSSSGVYTIVPRNKVSLEDLIAKICNLLGLRKGLDVPVVYSQKSEEMNLEDFSSISEPMEETALEGVFCTKFTVTKPSLYETIWTVEEISHMTTRELISAVFQNLSEKIKR